VRLEIATLLERKIRVIPVLVGGAVMPKSTELPECLQPLARRQAHEVSDNRFRTDIDRLIQVLETMMSAQPPSPQTASSAHPDSEKPKTGIDPSRSNQSKPESHITPPPKDTNWFAISLGIIALLFGATALYNDFSKPTEDTGTFSLPYDASDSMPLPATTEDKPIAIAANDAVTTKPVEKETATRLPLEPEMVRIPAGTFMMGSPESEKDWQSTEGPQREVTIAAFEMGKYEVTFDEYDVFAKATNRKLPDDSGGWGRGKQPVINVSWQDAQAYVQWLSAQTSKKYRLPTEAEWEYAARAGTTTRYWWGDDIGNNNAVCDGCGSQWDKKQTAPVGSFKSNAFGLYDTAGNMQEWVQDCWHDNYTNAPTDGSAWGNANGDNCSTRMTRGGSWYSNPQDLRSAYRSTFFHVGAGIVLGFRIARDF
jgi:formylglycine-generating enzyme required for sulfatase activity